jgi:hypothetical protein
LPSPNRAFPAPLTLWFGWVFLSLALLAPTLAAATPVATEEPAAAVTGPPAAPVPRTHRAHARPSLDERVRQFGRNLELSEDQQASVKTILEQRQQDTLRIRTDPSLTGETRIAQFRALQVSTVEKIRAVLNDEQRKKYNPLAPRDIPQAPNQRSVEDWLKLTTPK